MDERPIKVGEYVEFKAAPGGTPYLVVDLDPPKVVISWRTESGIIEGTCLPDQLQRLTG